jgi:5-methylcytosine-specific restriction endonuclease McrA
MGAPGVGPTGGPQEGNTWNGLKRSPLKRKRGLRRFGKKARRDRDELAEVKPKLLARSGGYCEARVSKHCTTVGTDPHHIVRRSQGGKNGLDNLVWTCRACHDEIHAYPEAARAVGLLAGASR